ncbi:ninein-like protein isoform X2 [Haliotis cracherodii]|uniref:ninein-like protein isoform X2 n=1 Tax=Haliotis cracherodii TaxID=6455 RepID=UPI0039EBF8EB
MMAESEEYSSQLREVFDMFDKTGEGALGREALLDLCKGLQLEEYSDLLLDKVLSDKKKVQFDDFKEAFVGILQDVAPLNLDDDKKTDVHVTPKYVLGGKTYGRRSKPDVLNDGQLDQRAIEDEELLDIETAASTGHLGFKQGGRIISPRSENEDNEFHIKRRRKDAPRPRGIQDETFEAEGQMNLTMTDADVESGQDKLLEVWRTLGVGQDGYLTLSELRTVCNYIELEMDEDEVWKLFKKLDNDNDGRVSFEELLKSFSQSSRARSLTPSPRPSRSIQRSQRPVSTPTIRSLSAQRKLRLGSTPAERSVTPVVLTSGEVTGLFTALDPWHSGFAQPEDVIDLWEKHNIMNGADILTALDFDHDTKLNLSELSYALEQALANENLDAVSHAALVTCQQELRHLRSCVDALTSERDKLKLDLQESNARAVLLAKEVDERHAHMEKSNESKLLTIEKKYQDQIRSLQGALESERETHSAHSAKLRQNLESEMEGLRQQETKLKENLAMAQEEVDRLQVECARSCENIEDVHRHNTRLQKELGNLDDLRRKLTEYEQTPDASEERQHHLGKINWLEQVNKDLKDKVDELTAELENLKQQLASCKRKLRGSSSSQTKIPIREGSQLSDYTRRKSSLASMSSTEAEVDDLDNSKTIVKTSKLARRKRPGRSSLEDDSGSEHSLSNSQKLDLLEKDHQHIEHSFRLEVAQLEDSHQAEKERIMANFEKEKEKLRVEFERSQQDRLAEQQKELQNVFILEKQDLLQKYESKKNLLNQEHDREKEELLNRLKEEYEKDLELRVGKIKENFTKEISRLEENRGIDRTGIRDLEKMCTDLERRLKTEREEAEALREKDYEKHEEEKELLRQAQARDREKLTHRLQAEHQQRLQQELGRSRDDHSKENSTLLSTSAEDVHGLEQKVADLDLKLKLQQEEIESDCDRQRDELEQKHQLQMKELETRLKLELLDYENMLEQGVSGLQGKLKEDFDALVEQGQKEATTAERAAMYEELSKHRSELEAEWRFKMEHMEQREGEYESEKRRVLEELEQKRRALEEDSEALEKRKADFDLESHNILDELDRQETLCEQASDEMKKRRQDFEDVKQKLEVDLETKRQDLERRLQDVGKKQEELEEEKERLEEEVHQRGQELQAERDLLEERKVEFEQIKAQYEDNLNQEQDSLNLNVQKRLVALEAEEALLNERKGEFESGREKQMEKMQVKEREIEASMLQLQQQKVELESEKEQTLNNLNKERSLLKEEQDNLLVRQRDIEKEYSSSLKEVQEQRQKLSDEKDDLLQRQRDFEQEHACVLKEFQTQREALKADQEKLDERRQVLDSDKASLLEDLQTQKDEVRVEKEKLLQRQREMETEHSALVNQLKMQEGDVQRDKMSVETLSAQHQAREQQLKQDFDRQKDKLCSSYEEEKTALIEKYQDEILDMQKQMTVIRQKLEVEKSQLEQLHQQDQLEREQDLREELQTDFVRQIEELQDTFGDERKVLDQKSQMLEGEITGLQVELKAEQDRGKQVEERLQSTVSCLQDQLKQVEDMRDSLQARLTDVEQEKAETQGSLERRIDELLSDREMAVTAVRAEVVETVKQTHSREKEKVQEEMTQMTSKMDSLQDQLTRLQQERSQLLEYKMKYEECREAKLSCEAEIRDLKHTVATLESRMNMIQNFESTQTQLLKERDQLQSKVTELKEKLKFSHAACTETEKLKVDLSNMTREKSELQEKVNSLKEHIQDSRPSKHREDKELHDEKKLLEKKLQKVSDKLLEASTALSVAQSRHLQEISRWKDRTKNMVDLEQFTNLQLGLMEQQRHMNELQAAIQEKLDLIEDLKEGHKKRVKQLEADKKDLHTKVEYYHNLFKEQAEKLMTTYESLSERNMMVNDLHMENLQLVSKVKVTEERHRQAEKRCLHVERKCASLQKVINQACQNIAHAYA